GLLLAAEMDWKHVQHARGPVALLAFGNLRQRTVLSAALPGLGRHAAAHSGLSYAVLGLEHDLLHWRIRVRRLPVFVCVHHLGLRSLGAASEGPGVGRRARPRVGAVLASPAALVANPAG